MDATITSESGLTAPVTTEEEVRATSRRFPNDFWIVVSYNYKKHDSLEMAEVFRRLLAEKDQKRRYHILHCKRRLEKNERSCEIITRQRAQIAALTAILRSIEWSADTDLPEGGHGSACPCCGGPNLTGHDAGCELAEALAREVKQ